MGNWESFYHVGRTAFRWSSQSLNEQIACARRLARFRVQARRKTAPIVGIGIAELPQQNYTRGWLRHPVSWWKGDEAHSARVSTRWKECWHLWLWVVESWNAQLDWNERNGPNWSSWQRLHTQITHFSGTWMTFCLDHPRFQHSPQQFLLQCALRHFENSFLVLNKSLSFGGFLWCFTAKASWMHCHCWLTTSKDLQWRIFFRRVAWQPPVQIRHQRTSKNCLWHVTCVAYTAFHCGTMDIAYRHAMQSIHNYSIPLPIPSGKSESTCSI